MKDCYVINYKINIISCWYKLQFNFPIPNELGALKPFVLEITLIWTQISYFWQNGVSYFCANLCLTTLFWIFQDTAPLLFVVTFSVSLVCLLPNFHSSGESVCFPLLMLHSASLITEVISSANILHFCYIPQTGTDTSDFFCPVADYLVFVMMLLDLLLLAFIPASNSISNLSSLSSINVSLGEFLSFYRISCKINLPNL